MKTPDRTGQVWALDADFYALDADFYALVVGPPGPTLANGWVKHPALTLDEGKAGFLWEHSRNPWENAADSTLKRVL